MALQDDKARSFTACPTELHNRDSSAALGVCPSSSTMACRLVSRDGEEWRSREVVWEGDSRWIPISAALLGEVGRMQVLTPSVLIHPAAGDSTQVSKQKGVHCEC